MSFNISATDFNSTNRIDIDIKSDFICPHCNRGISPVVIFAKYHPQSDYTIDCYTVLLCPNSSCSNIIYFQFQYYSLGPDPISEEKVYPPSSQTPPFPPEIEESYPRFIKIYKQSLEAETRNLDEIIGLSYRKSLEILIKDFLISKVAGSPDEAAIKAETLAQSIKRLSLDIQEIAKAAAWLGNDHSHYEQRHEEMTIKDLKNFIGVVVGDIYADIVKNKARAFVNKPKT